MVHTKSVGLVVEAEGLLTALLLFFFVQSPHEVQQVHRYILHIRLVLVVVVQFFDGETERFPLVPFIHYSPLLRSLLVFTGVYQYTLMVSF